MIYLIKILIPVIIMLTLATILQKNFKSTPCFCILSFIASLISWSFWLYYTSSNIRENSFIAKIGIHMTSEECSNISASLYIFSILSALIGTIYIAICLAKNNTKEANLIVLNIISIIFAWGLIFTVPGLAII